MKPAPFEYVQPESLDAALALLARHGGDAKPLAGGQSLVPALNFRVAQPALLIDLNRLADLDYVRASDGGRLHLGAMTRQRRLERDPLVARFCPLLRDTVPHIAHPQIRNRGTLGGSLVHADPAAELPVIAVALQARLRAQNAAADRWLSAEEFFLGMFTTALAPDELLVEIEFPALPERAGWSFVEFARRHGDYALMGVAALVTLDAQGVCKTARLVYLNAGDAPVIARQAGDSLQGQAPTEDAIEAAAVTASQHEIDPLGNVHASAAYQRHLARVLTSRALKEAFARAGGR